MIWLLVIVATSLFYYFCLYKPHQTWKNRNINYIKPWPLVGNMGPPTFFQTSFAEHVQNLYNSTNERYVGIYQFLLPSLMIKDVDLIKHICVKEFDSFMDHRTFISEKTDPLFGNVLFSMRGQKWKHMRATLSPAFTGSKMRQMFTLISACGEQFTDYFIKNMDHSKSTTVEMKDIFGRFANDVIASCAFGLQCDSLQEKNNEFYLKGKTASTFGIATTLKFFGYALSPFLMKLLKIKMFPDDVSNFFRNIITSTMKIREEKNILRPDVINILMEARKGQLNYENSKNDEDNAGFATVEESHIGKTASKYEWSDDEIIAQAVLFFIAGFDSISTMICHTAYELALNPDIQERLQNEIDNTLEECNNKFTYEALMKMKYLDMVISESLRKWPAGPFLDRICTKSITIPAVNPGEKPLRLEKGDSVIIPLFPIHRDPKYYPNPDKFDPERFNDENKDKIKFNTFLPFGVGPRNCIGSRFALLEAKIGLVHLLAKFNIIPDKKTVVPLRLVKTNFSVLPEDGFWVALQKRDK